MAAETNSGLWEIPGHSGGIGLNSGGLQCATLSFPISIVLMMSRLLDWVYSVEGKISRLKAGIRKENLCCARTITPVAAYSAKESMCDHVSEEID